VTLLATGSEVALAMEARDTLEAQGHAAAVVSMPSWELFDAQPAAYRDAVLGDAPRLAIEAASPFGWARYTGTEDRVVAMPGFGASAPAKDLYAHFDITAARLVDLAIETIG
ncbi:MAG: transketolase, partial [Alphaproteobacteria bacterium]|nr:transketolase [Alphaproteobacteria bacterium]